MRRALFEPWLMTTIREFRCKPAAIIYDHASRRGGPELAIDVLTATASRRDAATLLGLNRHDLKRLREALDVLRAELLL